MRMSQVARVSLAMAVMRPGLILVGFIAHGPLSPAPAKEGPPRPDFGPRPVIDAGKYFDPASPTCGLQKAIDAVDPSGGTVVIPPGTYPLRQSVKLRARVTVRGGGPATVLRKHPGRVAKLAADCPAGATSVEVKDTSGFEVGAPVGLTDATAFGGHSTRAVIKAVKPGRVELDRPAGQLYRVAQGALLLDAFPAVTAEGQDGVTVEELRIDGDLKRQPADAPNNFLWSAVYLDRCTTTRVRNVTVTDWPSDGICLAFGADAVVSHCVVRGCRGHGFHPGGGLARAVFTGNIATLNLWDSLFFCADVGHVTVADNHFSHNGWSGVGGLGAAGDMWNIVSSNTCAFNGRAGIDLDGGRNNTVTGNVCLGNSLSAPGRWPGILVGSSTRCSVTGNRCGDEQTPPTQRVGIAEPKGADHNLISGNHLHGSQRAVEKAGPHTQVVGNLE